MPDFGEYRPWLKHLALAVIPCDLRGRIDPSDIVQDTLYRALKAYPDDPSRTKAETMGWLRKVLKGKLIDALRNRWFDHERWDETSHRMSFVGTASANLIREEDALILAAMLEKLSRNQAEALVLKHCSGMPVEEICLHMGKSSVEIGGYLRHGMKHLRELMSRKV